MRGKELGAASAQERRPQPEAGEGAKPSSHTPGPWAWMGQGPHNIYLATTHSGRRYVMGFRRVGLQGAQPVFQINSRMVPAQDLLQFEVGDRSVVGLKAAKEDGSVYRYDIRGIASADAALIAAAPELLEALKALVRVARSPSYRIGFAQALESAADAAEAAILKAEPSPPRQLEGES